MDLTPTLGMMSGAVNPDAMLAAVSAAIFYCLARCLRRGLTRRLALGALTAVGLLTKLNFIGLAPEGLLGSSFCSDASRVGPGTARFEPILPASRSLLARSVFGQVQVIARFYG